MTTSDKFNCFKDPSINNIRTKESTDKLYLCADLDELLSIILENTILNNWVINIDANTGKANIANIGALNGLIKNNRKDIKKAHTSAIVISFLLFSFSSVFNFMFAFLLIIFVSQWTINAPLYNYYLALTVHIGFWLTARHTFSVMTSAILFL